MFLARPHVTGPEGAVTTPDVIVDCMFVDGARRPLALLTHECWQQGDAAGCRAAYAVTALGGGALISPALVLPGGPVVLARAAWRLANLDAHVDRVTLNGAPLGDVGPPSGLVAQAGGAGDALPRGYLLLRSAGGDAREAVLADPVLGRSLEHRVHFEALDDDRWGGARPRPRYSVGPTQRDVPHYI